MYDNGGVTTL